jgi:hypothetical protein
LKHHFWSFMLGLEFVLIGVYPLRSEIFPGRDKIWGTGRILILTAGTFLLGFILVVILPKVVQRFSTLEKFEGVSRYLVQASLCCSLSLLAVELILRSLIYNPPLRRDVTNWAGDLPGVHTLMLWGKEGYGLTQYIKWGEINTPYHDARKNNDVIVLGDSQTECLQVSDAQKFTSVAETTARRDGYDVDLHNLGRSGAAMADYVSWIPPYRSIYKPETIVVQLTMDDFTESFHEGQFNNFFLREDQKIGLTQTYDLSTGFIQKARIKINLVPQIKDLGARRWALLTQDTLLGAPAANEVSETSEDVPDENMNTGTFVPELADQQMQMLLEVSGDLPLIIVLLPSAPSISGNGILMDDPEHQQLKEFIERYPGITVVDPLPEFRELVSTGHMPRGFFNSTPGSGHLNNYGNEVVGQMLAQAIEQVLK